MRLHASERSTGRWHLYHTMATSRQTVLWTIDLGPGIMHAWASDRAESYQKSISRVNKPYQAQANSRLLSLPPELRIRIYEFFAVDIDTIAIQHDRLAAPNLGKVCRQIEREFCDIYTSRALSARDIRFQCVDLCRLDFDRFIALQRTVRVFEGHSDETERQFIVDFRLTNDFPYSPSPPSHFGPDPVRIWLHTWALVQFGGVRGLAFQASIDPEGFDVAKCREKPVPRKQLMNYGHNLKISEILGILGNALDRVEEAQRRARV
jgi:hypothetical protein